MKCWKTCATALVSVLLLWSLSLAQPYKDAKLSVETRVKDLLARMTPEEKFWQLFMLAGGLDGGVDRHTHGAFGFQIRPSDDTTNVATIVNRVQRHFIENTRLGIPIIAFEEALHGLVQKGATSYPQSIALAATFDTALMHRVSASIATDCRSRGIRQVLSPVVNIASDVRWGRTEETYGEDPYLASAMGVAFVSEFEKQGIITTPKHFIANVGDGGRDSYPIDLDERILREIHLPPFEACIHRGGARSIMTSYNSYDGSPCSANDWLNSKLLKKELGFTGFVISDAGAVGGANVLHFTAKDYPESGELALENGLDVIFQTSFDHYSLFSPPFLNGKIPSQVIDSAVARVLRAKFELGLFEYPYVDLIETILVKPEAGRLIARDAAAESFVLLKNDHQTLPLLRSLSSIAVIGPDAAEARLGGYSGPSDRATSVLEGLRHKEGLNARVAYAKGCSRLDTQYVTVPSSCLSCTFQDSVKTGLVGQYYANIDLSGTQAFTRVDQQIQFQWTLFSPDAAKLPYDCYSVRWEGKLRAPATGRYEIGVDGNDGYRLYLDGTLVINNWRKVSRRLRTAAWQFVKDHEYAIRIEYTEPTGNAWFRLVWNVNAPNTGDSLMNEAVALVLHSDAAIIVAGIEEGEFRDRASLALPGRQEELISKVAATGKQTVVLLVGGSAVTMSRWLDSVDAVLDIWYPGEMGGYAIADVLFGDANPSGRLPITFPVAEGQLPLVYNHKPTGRGDDYVDLTGQPQFPFGYGLSYTNFEYSALSFDRRRIGAGDSTVVRFTLKNTGAREGDEVVQLYVRDMLALVVRPLIELKGFQRVHLKAGESKALRFTIGPEALSMLNREMKRVVEPGDFRIMIGASSKDIRLHGTLTVTP